MNNNAEVFRLRFFSMWTVFPLALLAIAVVFDIVGLVLPNGIWSTMSFYVMAAGIIGGAFAVVFGLFDYLELEPETRAKTNGLLQSGANLLVVLLFAISWYLRRDLPSHPSVGALLLSWIGIMLSLFSGWIAADWGERSEAEPEVNSSSSLSSDNDEHIGHPHAMRQIGLK
jgi:uncharacterized membrane protein